MTAPSCLELFAGAGGLAKGLELAGAKHIALVENNKFACKTLRHNYDKRLVHEQDIQDFNFQHIGRVDIISGGPPCQPFSLGGKHGGNRDERDMFPQACRAIRLCTPKVFIFENVKGLLRKSFKEYFRYILLRLSYPEIQVDSSDHWSDHWKEGLKKLIDISEDQHYSGVAYDVQFCLLNAADYGVPQQRERVFIVGFRSDLNIQWSFPSPSHSQDDLLRSQSISQDYWQRHHISNPRLDYFDSRRRTRTQHLREHPLLFSLVSQPWRTVRDAIVDLPIPDIHGSFDPEHVYRGGAKSYPGHTGSYIDLPAKALKAGDHGVPGGENMIRYPDDTIRYFSILEAKRIQTFPDDYRIMGSWTEAMRQLGNAVPVRLGQTLADSIVNALQCKQLAIVRPYSVATSNAGISSESGE